MWLGELKPKQLISLLGGLLEGLNIFNGTSLTLNDAWIDTQGFGAQLIGPIQLHVKRQNSSVCKFFQDIAWTFFFL